MQKFVFLEIHNELSVLKRAHQKLAFENCSIYKASSVKGATWRSPWVGNILPEIHENLKYMRISPYMVLYINYTILYMINIVNILHANIQTDRSRQTV